MKTVHLNLNITFADKIQGDEHIAEIIQNTLSAILQAVMSGGGIAPEDSETFTTNVEISDKLNPKNHNSIKIV